MDPKQPLPQNHNLTYDLGEGNYIGAVYTHDEKTTPYSYEVVDAITPMPKPH